ncbi:hypothetical protein THMIRHAM_05480 [Thiomicrorhabdus immobilis]|uniref:Glycosyltransferase family 1 protein n=1 Tax=Thiomicrorhabdus immobilis TaxID=2791037 RepID=A0ABN6CV31_9GAMM|nr:hypothetical protein [Thiomicrorhabdus immobilis]BCN92763.1 hypothetical protein THMIRHAM_05480 [Thiomicrorhabdus immobilis]
MSTEHKTRVYIVEERENPSTDFFVLPQFESSDFIVTRYAFDELVSAAELEYAIVVFVRYLPNAWRKLISENRAVLQSLYFFMDDDVLDLSASKGMPLRYRWKLFKLAGLHKNWLLNQHASLWVSTPYLKNKYQAWSPLVIKPKPLKPMSNSIKVFYHGSASHNAEIEWLYPVIKEVLEQNSNLCFEIIGGQDVYKKFKTLPRVQVIHPMGWEAYQHFIQQPGRHIGLAPLLDNDFNQARSHTKVFDITRAGAVGVYSAGSDSAHYIKTKEENSNSANKAGIILPLEQKKWVEAITWLAKNEQIRTQMVNFAKSGLEDIF